MKYALERVKLSSVAASGGLYGPKDLI